MMLQRGCLSLEVVDAVSQQKCQENTEPSSGEVFVQVDPKAHYWIRLSLGGVDPNRVLMAYVYINDEYCGHRQCLSHRGEGFQTVGVCSTMIGNNQPIRFQEAKLLETHASILHMGKVTVKIYEGICDRRQSAFGNNMAGNSMLYQPGQFLETLTIHCCATPEAGHAFLNPVDADRLKKALMKRGCQENEAPTQSFKRVKTENGYVNVNTASYDTAGSSNGMDCDNMVLQQQQHAFPLA